MSISPRPLLHHSSKRLKIAVLVRRFITTGGAERYAVEVTKRLSENHEVHVFAYESADEIKSQITFHKVPRFFTRPRFINQLLFSFFTRRILDDSFDIIHSHERVTRFDVLTIHCPCYRGFIALKKTIWGKIKVWLSVATSPRHLTYLWLEKKQFSYKKNRLLIAVSNNVKKDVQDNYRLPDEYFRLAYPGVDLDQFDPAKAAGERSRQRSQLGISDDEIVILFVGTEFKRKGLDALLKAFSLLPEPNTRLLIAGGDDSRKYSKIARDLGIAESVIFLGLVKDMRLIYAMADICVLPTLSDPSPMAPIEAMAAGVATITSSPKFAGSSENIKNGEALMIDNPRDANEIAQVLGVLMSREYRANLGRKGRKLAEKLTWERTTAATLSVYHELMAVKCQDIDYPMKM